jgi:ABC-type polysaccharide/polyol phosphate transport system ATPase subunit
MTLAIRAHELGKRYRLGQREAYGSLRDSIVRVLGAPFRRRPSGDDGGVEDRMIWALREVSFDIGHGEILGVIGRNGSGKSTLLKILARITEPTVGRAEVRGRVGSLLEVGTGFHPELSGRENVYVNGAILGMRRAEIARKFDEIVAFSDLDRFIDTPVKHYSSGMHMRLAFAVAAHLEPEILLVDEILAVGDLAFQKKCLGKMDDVSRQGRTVLFVSHQMNQLRRLCGHCLWLESGRAVRSGPTAEVIHHYEASFMERTTAHVDRSSGAEFLDWTLGNSDAQEHTLRTFGPITVRFAMRVDVPIRNGHHGIVLKDRDGRILWGTGTDNVRLDPGLYEIVYAIEGLPVRPGPYRWHVTLYDNGHFINGLECIPEMSVETTPLGHRQDECAGVLNVPHAMDIRRADPLPEPSDDLRALDVVGG